MPNIKSAIFTKTYYTWLVPGAWYLIQLVYPWCDIIYVLQTTDISHQVDHKSER